MHVPIGPTVLAAAMTQLNMVLVTTVVKYTISTFQQSLQFLFYVVEFNHDMSRIIFNRRCNLPIFGIFQTKHIKRLRLHFQVHNLTTS